MEEINMAASWRDEAACKGMDTKIFFPTQGESLRPAQLVCGTCTVKAECLNYAQVNVERHGVFGGMGERNRQKLRNYERRNRGRTN